jgi:mono/diheme cytochrome c family protein
MIKSPLFVIGLLTIAFLAVLAPVSLAEAAPPAQTPAEGKDLFQAKCSGCHSVGGGRLVGPDLQGVTGRRDPEWLKGFIASPGQVIASGDPVARQLLADYNNVTMPDLGLNDAEVAALLAYLQDPAGSAPAAPAAPLPPGGVQAGQQLFSGEARLANGGPACIACHTVSGTGQLGGGSLGPDLTQVTTRLTGPGLSAALANIAFPTMAGPFLNHPLTPQEQADLVAYFEWANTNAPAPNSALSPLFLAAGLLGALVLFGAMAFFWPRQRETLAERLRRGG